MLSTWMIVVIVVAAVVLLILFYPLTYRLDADLNGQNARLCVYWLFRLLRFRLKFEDEPELVLAVAFFKVDFLDEENAAARRGRRSSRRRKRKKKDEKPAEEKSILQRITGIAKSAARVLSNLREYEIISEAFPMIRDFMYRIRPRDLSGCVEFGMSDPSLTGRITGAVAAVPYMYQTDLKVIPDFEAEKNYVSGDVHAKGHTMAIHVLILAAGLIRNRKVRAFIGELRTNNSRR